MKPNLWSGFKHVMSINLSGYMNKYSPDIVLSSQNLHLYNLSKQSVETYCLQGKVRLPDLKVQFLSTFDDVRMAGDDRTAVFIADKHDWFKATATSLRQLKLPRVVGKPVSVDIRSDMIAVACSIQETWQSVVMFNSSGLIRTVIPLCSTCPPHSVRIDPAGSSIYVANKGVVNKYDLRGKLLYSYGSGILSGGPTSIDLDDKGNLLVLDSHACTIHMFDWMGSFVGTSGPDFDRPAALRVNGSAVYVLDIGTKCVEVFQKLQR